MNSRSVAFFLIIVLFILLGVTIAIVSRHSEELTSSLVLVLHSPTPTRLTSTPTTTPTPTSTSTKTSTPTPTPTPTPAVLIGAGDISLCEEDGDEQTSVLVESLLAKYPHAAVFTAGDNAQSLGQKYEYDHCFNSTWGRFKDRIHPSPGNHDWATEKGSQYFAYFGAAAGKRGLGYYSYNLGSWHIVSLNSNCGPDGCEDKSAQAKWLRKDLERSDSSCTLLYWHHPLRSSASYPITETGYAFWDIASVYHAEIVVNGHEHVYERFTPLNSKGEFDKASGIRSFIVGTGGANLFDWLDPIPIVEVRENKTHGVIVFFLYPDHYEWKFVPVNGEEFTDAGSGTCH